MRATVAPQIAIAADLICLGLFVILGRESHGLDSGIGWYATVLWPFVAGWLFVAVLIRPYARQIQWRRIALTLLLGIACAQVLRVAFTHRAAPIAFVIVAYVFNVLAILGWRLALTVWVRFKQPQH